MLLGIRSRVLGIRGTASRDSRRIVAEALAAWEPDVDVGAVRACTSELVTDALQHGEGPLYLVIQHWTDCVRVTIINGGTPRGDDADHTPYGESSIRQLIVDGLATSRGVETLPVGTATWFDIETRPAPTRPLR